MRKYLSMTTSIAIQNISDGATITVRDARGRNDQRIQKLCQAGLEHDCKKSTFTARTIHEWNSALEALKVS